MEEKDNVWSWMTASRSDKPEKRFNHVSWSRRKVRESGETPWLLSCLLNNIIQYDNMNVQPVKKAAPLQKILPNMTGLKTDMDVEQFLFKSRKNTAVVNYGSSWCTHCHEMFPHMINLSKLFSTSIRYAVAQVDYLSSEVSRGIEYTPTFAVFSNGKKVDQFYGANAQQLYDHLWLHQDT